MSDLQTVLADIAAERARQDVKWGPQSYPDGTDPDAHWVWWTGDAVQQANQARQACERAHRDGHLTWRGIAREEWAEALACQPETAELREELIQNAAVLVAWIQDLDRRMGKP